MITVPPYVFYCRFWLNMLVFYNNKIFPFIFGFVIYCFKMARASDCLAKLKALEKVCSFNCSVTLGPSEDDFF